MRGERFTGRVRTFAATTCRTDLAGQSFLAVDGTIPSASKVRTKTGDRVPTTRRGRTAPGGKLPECARGIRFAGVRSGAPTRRRGLWHRLFQHGVQRRGPEPHAAPERPVEVSDQELHDRRILPFSGAPTVSAARWSGFSVRLGFLCRVYSLSRRQRGRGLRPPMLRDFPEALETGRLLIRSPMPGDIGPSCTPPWRSRWTSCYRGCSGPKSTARSRTPRPASV